MTEYTHFFGEMDLYLDQSFDKIYDHAFSVSEDCGYMVQTNKAKNKINLYSQDYDEAIIYFKNNKVVKAERRIDKNLPFETLNFKENIFEVDQKTLKQYNKNIDYQKVEPGLKMAMSPGLMIKHIIENYKIPALSVGFDYRSSTLGIETKKQFILWRDCGTHAELLGLIQKEDLIEA